MSKLIVTSSLPLRRRARHVFKGAMAFDLDHFSRDQLKAIAGDEYLTVVVGTVIDAGDVDEFVDSVAAAKEKADTKKTPKA